ncbi:tagatose-6-phosphate ketose isomerase [Paucibacter soli]|uniref:tagatose-6-phosphate ketose isomerase n=1 Tax=Paucibacter soli TaxID=3133433 RepID=UPI0030AB96FA
MHQRTPDDWRALGGLDTAQEIAQQPAVWRALAAGLCAGQAEIEAFLGDWLARPEHLVILTGAGSSAYVGEIAADGLNAAWPAEVRAIASTSLLSHPELYLRPERPTLLVSFARSGNSPESLATVELLRSRLRAPCLFLNISCNAEGSLVRHNAGRPDTLNLLMPAASCDRGFAMTSSFSSMLLAALAVLAAPGSAWPDRLARLEQLAVQGEQALQAWAPSLSSLGEQAFERIVYLGSGPLEALAKEAALKVLELSSGRSLALANTPLGFRHGPKSALNAASLVVVFRSAGALARSYEQDLLDELRRDGVAGRIVTVGPADSASAGADDAWSLPAGALAELAAQGDAWLAPLWLLMAQQFALHQSARLGLTPDNPFPDGTVNRVVQGVTIHHSHHHHAEH